MTYQSIAIHICARERCGARFIKPWQAPTKRYCSDSCRKRHFEEMRAQERHASGEIRPKISREDVIAAIQEWHATYGDIPSARDWNPAMARQNSRDDIADRFYADACWPHVNSVQLLFGCWNAGIIAAGFEPRKTRGPTDPRFRSFDYSEARRMRESGVSVVEIADRFGVSEGAIYYATSRAVA